MKANVQTVVISLLFLTRSVFAADVSGKVTDAGSGDFLPGANVVVEGTNFGASSDRAGNYTISGLAPGEYTLKVSYIAVSYTHLTLPTILLV